MRVRTHEAVPQIHRQVTPVTVVTMVSGSCASLVFHRNDSLLPRSVSLSVLCSLLLLYESLHADRTKGGKGPLHTDTYDGRYVRLLRRCTFFGGHGQGISTIREDEGWRLSDKIPGLIHGRTPLVMSYYGRTGTYTRQSSPLFPGWRALIGRCLGRSSDTKEKSRHTRNDGQEYDRDTDPPPCLLIGVYRVDRHGPKFRFRKTIPQMLCWDKYKETSGFT